MKLKKPKFKIGEIAAIKMIDKDKIITIKQATLNQDSTGPIWGNYDIELNAYNIQLEVVESKLIKI